MTTDHLSRRLRQTLACLLDGNTEKRAAQRLGISGSTLHQYVTMLYRHFGVTSRSELLIYCLQRPERG
jgi:DNA-binding CsgD family transcriptional regulator